MNYNAPRALELLRLGCSNPIAQFREGQEEAIRHTVIGPNRLLLVQKTGWGKSFVYFIAAKLFREAGNGPTLLISPLLALMRNQIAAAERMGLQAVTINSDNECDWENVESLVAQNEIDVLLVSPERLANERFRKQVLARIAGQIALLVIDEAHCISDWGHDFRPHYRLLERIITSLPPNLRLLATTATANNRVMGDLQSVLGPDIVVSKGDLNRPSLKLQTIKLPNQAERLAWLAEQMKALAGSGIIYTLTVRDATLVAGWLKFKGYKVDAYTGQTGEDRPLLEQALLENRIKALVATTALGMGFDKPDLAFIIHYQTPGSVVAYYQQVGRGGRALNAAYGVLLSGEEDQDITNYFITSAFPTQEEVRFVLHALEAAPQGLSINELMGLVNISWSRLMKTLELLSLESPSPIVKHEAKWQLTASRLHEFFWERTERLTTLRYQEQQQMQEYVALTEGHMEFLIRALDGDPRGLTSSSLPNLSTIPDKRLLQEAIAYLKRTEVPIEPRVMWPATGMPEYGLRGRIDPQLRLQSGLALCVWGDSGWGKLVQQGKYTEGRFDNKLVDACVTLLREWDPQPAPTWITCIPSLRHTELVPDFARRLACALKVPFYNILVQNKPRPEQKTMANSMQQARNIDGSIELLSEHLPSGPVLLLDDIVDSRWTLTVAAWLLRSHGSSKVFALTLASTGSRP